MDFWVLSQCAIILWFFLKLLNARYKSLRRQQRSRLWKCKTAPRAKQRDPILGLDLILRYYISCSTARKVDDIHHRRAEPEIHIRNECTGLRRRRDPQIRLWTIVGQRYHDNGRASMEAF